MLIKHCTYSQAFKSQKSYSYSFCSMGDQAWKKTRKLHHAVSARKFSKSTSALVRRCRSRRRPIKLYRSRKFGAKNRLRMLLPHFYFEFSRNRQYLASPEQITAWPIGPCSRVLLHESSFPLQPPKPTPNFGSALRASPFDCQKCSSPHFSPGTCPPRMQSRSCRARLRPRRVFSCQTQQRLLMSV